MYRINQIFTQYNYDENVVVTSFYTQNEKGEKFRKQISSDKTPEQMVDLAKTWSLTTLSINTDISVDELKARFGHSFKNCLVRYLTISLSYDYKKKIVFIDSLIEANTGEPNSKPQYFDLHSECPMPDDDSFEKNLQLPNLVGYKKI